MVGSSSSSRSLGHISARASCRRIAPAAGEAVDGFVQLGHLEAQAQDERLRTRHGVVRTGVVQVGVGMGKGHAVVVGSACASRAWTSIRRVSPATTKSVAGSSVSGMFWATCDMRHCGGMKKSPPVFVQAAVEQGKQTGFTGTVAADEADMLSGLMVALARSSSTLALRAKNDVLR